MASWPGQLRNMKNLLLLHAIVLDVHVRLIVDYIVDKVASKVGWRFLNHGYVDDLRIRVRYHETSRRRGVPLAYANLRSDFSIWETLNRSHKI